MAIDCGGIIKKLATSKGWSEADIDDFLRQAEQLKKRRAAARQAGMSQAQIDQLSKTWADSQKLAALQKKVNTHRQIVARTKLLDFCLKEFAGMEPEGLYAAIAGTKYTRQSGRLSVDAIQRAIRDRYLEGLTTDLKALSETHYQFFKKAHHAREIAEATWLASDKNGRAMFRGPDEAWEIGQVIHKWSEQALTDANNAGAWIRPLKGFIVTQSHDQLKIAKAGYQNWRDYIEPRLDWERIKDGAFLDPGAAADKETFLRNTFNALSTGIHLAQYSKKAAQFNANTGGSEAARLSHERILHFKSGGDWFDYNQLYGRGTLNEAVLHGLDHTSQSIGLMRVFGPGPQETLEWVIKELAIKYNHEANTKGANMLRNLVNGKISHAMQEVDGTLNIDGNPTAAEIGRIARAWKSMTSLGGALLSSFSDVPGFAAELAYQGHNPFKAVADGLKYFVQGRGSLESQQILGKIGVFMDAFGAEISARFSGAEIPGRMTGALSMYFRLNGLSWWTDSWKRAAGLLMANDWAEARAFSYDALKPQQRRLLSQYGISEDRWEVIRKAKADTMEGNEYLTMDGINGLSDSDVGALFKGKQASTREIAELREELATQYSAMIRDRVMYAVLEPDAANKRMLRRGQAAGTVVGEVLRYCTQFKSFPTLFLMRPMAREIYGKGADTFLKGMGQMFTRSVDGDRNQLPLMMVAMTLMGYVSMTCKQLSVGLTPRPLDDHKTWLAAAAQGGGAGVIGDFLFGARNRMGNTLLAQIAGPVAGDIEALYDIGMKMRDGDVDVGPQAIRWLQKQIPGNNLYYLNGAMQYLALNEVYEKLQPGYIKRMKKRLAKENGQTFLIDPQRVYDAITPAGWSKPKYKPNKVQPLLPVREKPTYKPK